MARENRTRFAILGMLMSGPKSGYDLKQDFEQRISPFWSESLGQIYPALHRMDEEPNPGALPDLEAFEVEGMEGRGPGAGVDLGLDAVDAEVGQL